IDVGASKGDILDLVIDVCPDGNHIAIEAIPVFCRFLESYYAHKPVKVINAEHDGNMPFYFVANEPAISGTTKTNKPNRGVDRLNLPSIGLDSIFAEDYQVHCIKIDCIGSELAVIKGASQMLANQKPLIVFECTPTHNTIGMALELYDYLHTFRYNIYLLDKYPEHLPLDRDGFKFSIFNQSKCQFFAQ
ncbi:MAG: FkbM family methyltransferase, partial [Pricia sp.]|nr:FkbM family methyltransferase [Pricia sp.]